MQEGVICEPHGVMGGATATLSLSSCSTLLFAHSVPVYPFTFAVSSLATRSFFSLIVGIKWGTCRCYQLM